MTLSQNRGTARRVDKVDFLDKNTARWLVISGHVMIYIIFVPRATTVMEPLRTIRLGFTLRHGFGVMARHFLRLCLGGYTPFCGGIQNNPGIKFLERKTILCFSVAY